MATPNGSASGPSKVTQIAADAPLTPLEIRLSIGQPSELKATGDHSQLMELILSTIPETVVVRWVGINNAHQIARHLNAGYDYVKKEDGIMTVSGQIGTDATGQYIVIGDCVLMACSKEAYNTRRKVLQRQGEQRLAANLSGDEIKQNIPKHMTVWERTSSMEAEKP